MRLTGGLPWGASSVGFAMMLNWAAVLLLLAHPSGNAADLRSGASASYPSKPVRIVVAFAAGGFADTIARQFAQKLSERIGQNFVIDNRGGAGGNVGARMVAEAAPDGHTLLVHTAASSINVSLYGNLGFDLLKDLAPVANTVSTAGLFVVLSAHPVANLQDLIRQSKGRRLNYGTAGVGTSSHIAADYLLRVLAKIDAVHIPFKGGGPAVTALLGKEVELLNSSAAALPHVQAGRMKALGVASLTRVQSLPDVPTVVEAGFPGFEERSWVGFFAPARTPANVVANLNREINQVLALPDIAAGFRSRGMDLHPGPTADFARYVQKEVANWAKMVKMSGVKVE